MRKKNDQLYLVILPKIHKLYDIRNLTHNLGYSSRSKCNPICFKYPIPINDLTSKLPRNKYKLQKFLKYNP